MNWRDRAVCNRHPEPFATAEAFDRDAQSQWREVREACVNMCASCPVLAECKADMMRMLQSRNGAPSGVRAGMTVAEQERAMREAELLCSNCETAAVSHPGGVCTGCVEAIARSRAATSWPPAVRVWVLDTDTYVA